MAIIKPFKALRPAKDWAQQVASRPYDVLNSQEAKEEVKGNPYSFLHVTKSEVNLPDDIDSHSMPVYEKAKENLLKFIENGTLLQEEKACYYIYLLIMPARHSPESNRDNSGNGRSQTGLACVSSVQDYFNDIIKKHEFTRPEKELDRINHIKTTRAQTGNVFIAYNNVAEMDELIEQWKKNNAPVYNFTAEDKIQHSIWVVNDEEVINSITSLFNEKVPCTYIADGHHRAASAAKVSMELPDSEEANYFLTTIFPASQLAIMDYNRLITDLNGLSSDAVLKKLEADFSIEKSGSAFSPKQLHQFGMYLDGQWYILTSKEGTYTTDPIGILDITILSNNVLNKLLGIKDQRTDKRIDFVGGIRGLGELEKRVNSGEMKLAFSVYPVSIQQLFDIADSGNVMPPKSTWFEPKLRDGLLTHLI